MPTVPTVLKYGGRSFRIGDRVKCFVWRLEDPLMNKWIKGTIVEFFPSRITYKWPTSVLVKKSWEMMKEMFPDEDLKITILVDDEEKGIITYDDYYHIRMSIRTDERVSNNPDDLFEGFGWNVSGQNVIFENEPEYDPFPSVQESDQSDKLPF